MPNDNDDRKNLQGREDKDDRSLDGPPGQKPEPRSGQDPNPNRSPQGEGGSGKPVSNPSPSSDESEESEDR